MRSLNSVRPSRTASGASATLESGHVLASLGQGRSTILLRSGGRPGWSGGGVLAFDPVETFEVRDAAGPPFLGTNYAPFEGLADAIDANPSLLWAGHMNYTPAKPNVSATDMNLPALRFCGYAAWMRIGRDGVTFGGQSRACDRMRSAIAESDQHLRDVPESAQRANARPVGRSFDRGGYIEAVEAALEHIRAGDFYQVNIAQRFEVAPVAGPEVFVDLDRVCRAPFAAYFDGGDYEICSASPELFLRVREGVVTTRPIKGTRPRSDVAEDDTRLAAELIASEKERAENLMVVDLERNDLGRIAVPGTVIVPELWRVESFQTVHHLVSTVEAQIDDGVGLSELLRATFPGGSITGAPKLAAMEFIDRTEPVARSIYTGAIGWIAPRPVAPRTKRRLRSCPDLELNVAIRTVVTTPDATRLWVGSGIVADSDPAAEYRETLDKAVGIASAIGLDLDLDLDLDPA